MEIDPVTRVLTALSEKGSHIKKQGKEWKAQCPSHDDQQASLQVGYGEKGAVLNCQAGCKTTDVVAALNMKMTELFNPDTLNMVRNVVRGQDSNVIDRYQYTDETGQLLFEVEKRVGKKFLQRVPDDNAEGGWRYSLGNTRRVLYRLRAVVHARTEQLPIYVVEGEKDVHTLEGLGLVATCNPGGAGKWRSEYNDFFHGAHVIILPDNDKPGALHADLVTQNIKDVARSVRIINLPVQEKGDVSDWVQAGGTKEELEQLAVAAEVVAGTAPMTFTAADLMMQDFPPMRWAVEPIIAEGLTLLVGRPKIGKSWLSFGLALAIAGGAPALNTLNVEQGKVLYLALEDTPRRLQSRMTLMLNGAPVPDDLHFATNWPKMNVGGLQQIEVWLEDNPEARLVIVDTYAKIKAQVSDESMYQADYQQISQFKSLADRYGVPIVLVHHQRKAADEDPLNTISGSTGLTGAADAAIILTRQRGADDGYLYVTGRDVEENRYLLSFESSMGQWTYMGEAEEMEEANNENNVIKLLADAEDPMGPKEIATTLGIPEGTAKWLTSKLAQEDKITRVGRGKYVIGTGVQKPAGPIVMPGQVSLEDAFGDLEDDLDDGFDDEGEE